MTAIAKVCAVRRAKSAQSQLSLVSETGGPQNTTSVTLWHSTVPDEPPIVLIYRGDDHHDARPALAAANRRNSESTQRLAVTVA